MNVSVLGPLEANVDGRPVALGAGKPRALLAILALHVGEPVSTERLIDGLWGERPPATATKLVQLYVSQLRKALVASGDGAAIVTRGHGYELHLSRDDIDVGRFERLLADGAPREALALWRGPALDDVAGEPFAASEIRRLEELRLCALEQAIDADLEAGRHREIVGELEALVAEDPLRERRHAQRMLALYRSGRQAEALEAYREARDALVEQVGVEPGPELRRLQEAVLRQDPVLDAPTSVAGWARADAASRLQDAAGRAASERAGLRAAEDEVAGSVEDLQASTERGPEIVACPFKGLASFDVDDAGVFFGRERLVAELVARAAGAPLMAVVGPSGSGKSSALRAGLLAALAGGVLPGSERWPIALLRPGEHPLRALEHATAGVAGRSVVAVDQFEELFTACREEPEREAFAAALADRAGDPRRHTLVLIAVRADFYGHCAAYPELSRLMGANHVLVGPMRRDELRRAIELPAERAGLVVEPELADALVADVVDEPGALPLLSSSLLELWQRRDGRRLRLVAYDQAGGVRGAVARLAESAYERLDPERREVARRILLRLAEGEGDTVVRRRLPLGELEGPGVAETLAVLADQRLVAIGEGEVEVAHEALLREWPRLRGWLEEDREGRRVHAHLIAAARDWQQGGRDPGELYRGARLAAALDWAGEHGRELNATERAFVEASHARAAREAERQRRANRRLRALLATVALLLAAAVIAGAAAISQRGEARQAALTADARRLGAEAQNQERLDQALLFALAGVELDETPATRGDLLSVLQRMPAAIGVVDHGAGMYGAAISADGKLMAIGDERGSVVVYDDGTHQPLARPYRIGSGLVQDVRFSPDGRTLAVSSLDESAPGNDSGRLDLIDPRTGERRLRVRLPALPNPAPFVIADVAFPPNGRDLLVRPVDGASPGGQASPVYRVDGTTGALTGRLEVGRYASGFNASETSDRRRMFLTSRQDQRTWAIDTQRLRVVRSWPVGDQAGAVSPDGRLFALGSQAGRIRLVDLASGRVRPLQGGHRGGVSRMRFTPDGRTLVTAGEDGQVLVWDVERGSIAQRFAGHSREVDGLDLTADGRTLITASLDGRAILWDLAGDRRLDRRFSAGTNFDYAFTPRGIAVSPDGRTLALTHSDGTVDLLDTATLRRRGSLPPRNTVATAVAFSPDGRLLAVTGVGGRVTLWNARTLASAGEIEMPIDSDALAFSADGKLLAAAEEDVQIPLRKGGTLRVWDMRRRTLTAFRGGSAANSIAFSPDSRLLAAAETEGGTEVRQADTGELVKRLDTGDFARSVAFSPDGTLLFVGQYDGRGHLLSTQTWKPVGRPLDGHTARITSAEFTRDGRTLVTAAADGTAILWDVRTQKPIGSPIVLASNTFASAALSPDGSRLFAVSTRGDGIRFDISPEDWKRHACLVAGRRLTRAEWEDAVPRRGYVPVCRG